MDEYERRVVKRKRHDLVQHLTADDRFIHYLRRHDVLDIEGVVDVLDIKTNAARVSKLVDSLCKSTTKGSFDKFCHSLMTFDLIWLAKEMKTDLLTTRGSAQIDDDVKMEAAILVHSKFGNSKRMCERDKKDIQEMVAVKIQMAKEEWREEVESLRKQLHDYKIEFVAREEKMKRVITSTKHYLKDNESSLVTLCHDMRSTSEVLRTAVDDGDIVTCFQEILDDFLGRVTRIVKERDMFYSERLIIAKTLGLSYDDYSIVDAVKQAMMSVDTKSTIIHDKLVDRDLRLSEKQQRVDSLEAKLLRQSEKIKSLTTELRRKCEAKLREEEGLSKGQRRMNNLRKTTTGSERGSTSSINQTGIAGKTDPKSKQLFPNVTKLTKLSPPLPTKESKAPPHTES